ncbi:hypothetical protein EauS123_00047 [Exiguobacterium phage vB_EauS-123]|nr:hypothetical protein EauS123_00047 [Exiguobacterium phage vB_EauS-123]
MDQMTIGMCFDYIDVYFDFKNPNAKKTRAARQATQNDFNSF